VRISQKKRKYTFVSIVISFRIVAAAQVRLGKKQITDNIE
jgi:hypothetical protein